MEHTCRGPGWFQMQNLWLQTTAFVVIWRYFACRRDNVLQAQILWHFPEGTQHVFTAPYSLSTIERFKKKKRSIYSNYPKQTQFSAIHTFKADITDNILIKKINLQKSSAHSAKMNTRFCLRIPCIQKIFRSKIFPLWSKRKYVFTACTGTY